MTRARRKTRFSFAYPIELLTTVKKLWTSKLTGAWHTTHGVDSNDDSKNDAKDTIMLKYAKLGLNTGLAFDWGQYFDVTLSSKSIPISVK